MHTAESKYLEHYFFLTLVFLQLLVVFSTNTLNCLGQELQTVGCARDSIYLALDKMAVTVSIGDVESQLPESGYASAADVIRVMLGFDVDAYITQIEFDNLRALESYIIDNNHAAIVMLPIGRTEDFEELYHFVCVGDMSHKELTYYSTEKGMNVSVPTENLAVQKVPVILCTVRRSLLSNIVRALTSWNFTYSLLVALCLEAFFFVPFRIILANLQLASFVVLVTLGVFSVVVAVRNWPAPSSFDESILPSNVDLGKVRVGERVQTTIDFENSTGEEVCCSVKSSSCHCLDVKPSEIVVLPGATGLFHCDLEATSYGPGSQQILFSIKSNSRDFSHTTKISYQGIDYRVVQPPEVYLGAISSLEHSICVASFKLSDKSLKLTDVKILDEKISDSFSVNIVENEIDSVFIELTSNSVHDTGPFSFPIAFILRDESGSVVESVCRLNGEVCSPGKIVGACYGEEILSVSIKTDPRISSGDWDSFALKIDGEEVGCEASVDGDSVVLSTKIVAPRLPVLLEVFKDGWLASRVISQFRPKMHIESSEAAR